MLLRGFRGAWVLASAVAVWALAQSPARAADEVGMTFSIVAAGDDCPNCVVINASGEITDTTSRDFALFLAESRLKGLLPKEARKKQATAATGPKVVMGLDSIGGKVIPALVIGRRVRQLGWTTVVGQASRTKEGLRFEASGCYSACSMMMLGGVERYVVPGSKPGVHQFSPQFKDEETFSAADMNVIVRDYARQVVGVYDYISEMGVDVSFFIATMRTPFTGMDVLAQERWTKLGLATAVLPGAPEMNVAAILGRAVDPTPRPGADTMARAKTLPPASTGSIGVIEAADAGTWVVADSPAGHQAALFSDQRVSLSLACTQANEAMLELTFKALDPIDLEHLRAAAFSAKRLSFAERQIAISSVAAPRQGEQAVAAVLDMRDLKALQGADALTFAVLDRSGKPATHAASVTAVGAASAIANAMARCGGV
jgi:hypothetical protein